MADKRFRGRDKIVQKMTKDGLVEENLRTGETKSPVEEEPPKQEDSEKDAAESAEETPVVEEDVCMDAEDGEEEKPRRSTAKQSTEYYKAHQEDGKAKEKDASPVDEDAKPAPKKHACRKSKGSGAGGRCAEQDPLGGTWHSSTDAHADYGRILKLFSSDPWNGQYLYRNDVSQ